jgi:hypothetical protein
MRAVCGTATADTPVTIGVFQDVFCRMVASSAYRDWILGRPDEALDGLDLSDRERRRLLAVAAQPGMRLSTSIHRANRLTPLHQTLPLTCTLLGDTLGDVLERYWMAHTAENLQVPSECERFAGFLERELADGRLSSPFLAEVLAFERACTALRFWQGAEPLPSDSEVPGLPPLVRIVRFAHDPVPLLDALASKRPPPPDLPTGEFHVVIDCRSGEAEFRLLDAEGLASLRKHGLI